MKIGRSIFCFVAIVAILTVLAIWFGKKKSMEKPLVASTETNAMPVVTITSRPSVSMSADTNAAAERIVTATTPLKPGQSKEQRTLEILSTANDVPIVFYGKVEDQFNNPVANAHVNFGVRINNGYESTVKSGQVVCDANGLFTISGYKGESLGIGVDKTGYVFASMKGSGIYSKLWPEDQRAHPDPNNPVVIKMWKLQGSEPLVGLDKNYKLHYTNAPICIDLLAGRIVPSGGDIKIIVNRPPGIVSERNPQDWGFKIEVIDGGLMKSSEQPDITYWAPESGYRSSDILTASSNRHGIGVIQEGFFIQSRNGQVYSKLSLTFGINDAPDGFMYITFSGVANTNGSRNWEATAPR